MHRGTEKGNASDCVTAAQLSVSLHGVSDIQYEEYDEVPYWDGMNMIDKESNRNTPFIRVSVLFFVHQLVVELDEKQSLVLHCCE